MKLELTADGELELDYDFLGEIATSIMLDAPDRVSHVVAHDDDFAMFEDPEPGILSPFSSSTGFSSRDLMLPRPLLTFLTPDILKKFKIILFKCPV